MEHRLVFELKVGVFNIIQGQLRTVWASASISQTPAFITVKDHKPSFPSKVDVRLLNPAKPQLGKITKVKLQEINSELRAKTHLNQLQSTNDAISWFNALNLKKRRHFLIFYIVSFYPSISEDILKKTFAWARSILRISEADERE